MGFPFERLRADDPYRGATASVGVDSFQLRAREGVRMERLPESLSIALWTAGACWLLAIMGYVFGASRELILSLGALGVLTGVAEFYLRNRK